METLSYNYKKKCLVVVVFSSRRIKKVWRLKSGSSSNPYGIYIYEQGKHYGEFQVPRVCASTSGLKSVWKNIFELVLPFFYYNVQTSSKEFGVQSFFYCRNLARSKECHPIPHQLQRGLNQPEPVYIYTSQFNVALYIVISKGISSFHDPGRP